MRQVSGFSLWVGNVADGRDLRAVLSAGVEAVVDLALNEPPSAPTRELVYCRFPLVDGAGNPSWLLRTAVETVAGLLRAHIPTLVFCGAGMSRSPAVSAVALSLAFHRLPVDCLELVTRSGPCDVSAGLWSELLAARPAV
ncbi:protein phosphatase [Gemmata obscuriglobus]|uniref:Protein phosphatase n=1 Tax=Gemmata obscuriglobus TaxID=114 RepID=A0A2Z3H9H3_9BACT|nr:protein phosphatase [Gemmata obscuriglobus]